MLFERLYSFPDLTTGQIFLYPTIFVEDEIITGIFIQLVYVVCLFVSDKMPSLRIKCEFFELFGELFIGLSGDKTP